MTDRSVVHLADPTSADALAYLYFHCAFGFDTQILAYTLDSLVRVSRRVDANHFVKIANMRVHSPVEASQYPYTPVENIDRVSADEVSL